MRKKTNRKRKTPYPTLIKAAELIFNANSSLIEIDGRAITPAVCTTLVYLYGYYNQKKYIFSDLFLPDIGKSYGFYWPDFSRKSQQERALAILFFREMLITNSVG